MEGDALNVALLVPETRHSSRVGFIGALTAAGSAPELGDMFRLPDFSSDIDPGPGEPFPGSRCISAGPVFMNTLEPGPGMPSPESGDIPDQPSFIDKLDTRSGKSFPRYGGALWVQDLFGDSEDDPKALLQESGARLHVLNYTGGMD